MKGGRIRLQPPGGTFPGVDSTLAGATGVDRDAVLNFDWTEDGSLVVLYRLTVADPEELSAALDADDDVFWYETRAEDGDVVYLLVQTVMTDMMAEVMTTIGALPLLIQPPFRCTESGFDVWVLGEPTALQDAHDDVSDVVDLTVDRVGTYSPEPVAPLRELTDRQREALETAYELGFYETPREASYEEIAAELDCVPSAANDLIRRSESTLVAGLLDG